MRKIEWLCVILVSLSIGLSLYTFFVVNNILNCLNILSNSINKAREEIKKIENTLDINTDNNFRGKR